MSLVDYQFSGLFPGPDGSGSTSANSHPYTFLTEQESITLGSGESGVYVPINNFKYGNPDALDEAHSDADIRFFALSMCDLIHQHEEGGARDVKSFASVLRESDLPGGVKQKAYTFFFNLADIPDSLRQFSIDKPEA
ncbi:MAG: hypothetical protein EBY39_07345 [Flavobacteriia bacterium]|nr:hypothetical protein [Flavobacteriia bacterium]